MRFRRLVVVRTRAAYQDTVRGSVVSVAATGLVVALVCAVVIGLSGQTRLTQQRIDDRIESASSRLIRLRDVDGGAGLDTAAVESLQKVEQLAWVVGFTPTRDVGNQVFGGDVFSTPAVGVEGDIDRLYPGASHHLGHEADRAIAGDRALASLGMPTGRGGVYFEDGASLSIVGPAHAAHDPERQDRLVVYRAHPDSGLSSILVLVRPGTDLATLGRALPALTGVEDPSTLHVEYDPLIERLGWEVSGEIVRSRQAIILLTLGGGLLLLTIDGFASSARRRKDVGRRRALGATRSQIVASCLLERLVVALPAATTASLLGVVWVARGVPDLADLRFGGAVAVLGTTCAVIAAVPPGLRAAWSDPVRVLRVP